MTSNERCGLIRGMEVNWETNSKVKKLAALGFIKQGSVLPRSTTDDFPTSSATVRLHGVRDKKPWVVIHIRGDVRKQIHNWGTGEYAKTMRVSFGRDWSGYSTNGELCETLDFSDVDKAVKEVKGAMSQ